MIRQVGLGQGGYRSTASLQKSGTTGSFLELFQAEQAKGITAKQYLSTLTSNELSALQKESHLAAPVNIVGLSEEGAYNLLAEGDQSQYVDLNNDGITEVGAAKDFIFPPPNAPQAVKDAWNKTAANLPSQGKGPLLLPFFCEQIIANAHRMPDGSWKVTKSGEPGYRNAFAGDTMDYCNTVDRMIDELEANLKHQNIADQQVTKWELSVLRDFSGNMQATDSTVKAQVQTELVG